MKKLCGLLVLACFLSLPVLATAAPKVKIIYRQGKDKIIYKKNQSINFNETSVDGEILKPMGTVFSSRESRKFKSLIQYRSTFLREMMKGAKKL